MKTLLIIALLFITTHQAMHLGGSTWVCKVAPRCVDTLRFRLKNQLVEHSCEQDYTFHGSYKMVKDTLYLTEKDDSHSEDGGKPTYYRNLYLVQKNVLLPVGQGILLNGYWKYKYYKPNPKNAYHLLLKK